MMQRKKYSGNDGGAFHHNSTPSSADIEGNSDDDGGSAKSKQPSHLQLVPRLRAEQLGKIIFNTPDCCLPGVPMVLKLVILSFVGFALLVVLTAKGRHAHWRYKNVIRAPHMPEPLLDRIKRSKNGGSSIKSLGNAVVSGDNNSESSLDATQRMLAQPSKFVESEKKLKQQLLKLLEKQNQEKKHKPNDPNDSVLGIKISTRYLGEDILPYPDSKGNEKEWERKMEARKQELAKVDETEWNDMIQQYNEIMEHHIQVNDHVDHALGTNADEERMDHFIDEEVAHEKKAVIQHPPRGSEQWPSPSEKAGVDTTILLKPAFGSHRPSQDAILIFAEGYDLSIYLAFVESLIGTGYSGDLVISISNEAKLKPGVKEYLQSKNSQSGGVNIVAYEVNWSCFKQSGETASGANEGVNWCKMDNAYGDSSGNPVSDPREPRPVATARYELYWMWSLQYNKESWLMLIDARDVWFQLHPFKELEDRGKVSGELHLFGVSFAYLQSLTPSLPFVGECTQLLSFFLGKC